MDDAKAPQCRRITTLFLNRTTFKPPRPSSLEDCVGRVGRRALVAGLAEVNPKNEGWYGTRHTPAARLLKPRRDSYRYEVLTLPFAVPPLTIPTMSP